MPHARNREGLHQDLMRRIFLPQLPLTVEHAQYFFSTIKFRTMRYGLNILYTVYLLHLIMYVHIFYLKIWKYTKKYLNLNYGWDTWSSWQNKPRPDVCPCIIIFSMLLEWLVINSLYVYLNVFHHRYFEEKFPDIRH